MHVSQPQLTPRPFFYFVHCFLFLERRRPGRLLRGTSQTPPTSSTSPMSQAWTVSCFRSVGVTYDGRARESKSSNLFRQPRFRFFFLSSLFIPRKKTFATQQFSFTFFKVSAPRTLHTVTSNATSNGTLVYTEFTNATQLESVFPNASLIPARLTRTHSFTRLLFFSLHHPRLGRSTKSRCRECVCVCVCLVAR